MCVYFMYIYTCTYVCMYMCVYCMYACRCLIRLFILIKNDNVRTFQKLSFYVTLRQNVTLPHTVYRHKSHNWRCTNMWTLGFPKTPITFLSNCTDNQSPYHYWPYICHVVLVFLYCLYPLHGANSLLNLDTYRLQL